MAKKKILTTEVDQRAMLALVKDAQRRLEDAKVYRRRRVMEALSIGLTQEEIGETMGITRQAVAEIRDRAPESAPGDLP
jgi:hypothetical protein